MESTSVVDREQRADLRWRPALEPGQRRPRLGVRDRDQRHTSSAGSRPALCARGLTRAARLPSSVVRRPQGVARGRRRRARRARRSDSSDPAASSMPACGSPVTRVPGHRAHGGVGGLAIRDLVPVSGVETRVRHRPCRRPSRSCGPWRSGCSREIRRAALFHHFEVASGRAAFDLARERERGPAAPGQLQRGSMRVQWGCHASRSSSASRAARPSSSRLTRSPRRVVPCDSRRRIEVDAQLVGMVERAGADGIVQLDAAEIHDPRQPGRIVDDLFRRAPRRERQGHRAQPLGRLSGARFPRRPRLPRRSGLQHDPGGRGSRSGRGDR